MLIAYHKPICTLLLSPQFLCKFLYCVYIHNVGGLDVYSDVVWHKRC